MPSEDCPKVMSNGSRAILTSGGFEWVTGESDFAGTTRSALYINLIAARGGAYKP
jgi:hypothetical protein